MVAQTRRQHLTVPVAPLAGAIGGIVVALGIALMPVEPLEDVILASGLPAILPAAAPPLGDTARLGLAMVAGGGLCLTLWFILFLVIGGRAVTLWPSRPEAEEEGVPVLRRADAHPDAPARRPLFASQDLGMPFPQGAVEADADTTTEDEEAPYLPALAAEFEDDGLSIPKDLDTPLARFDPESIRIEAAEAIAEPAGIAAEPIAEPLHVEAAEAAEPAEAPLPIARPQIYEPGERFETFDLSALLRPETILASPMRRDAAAPATDPEATITSLLERLERSVAKRKEARQAAQPRPARSMDETLQALRDLATRAASYSSS